MTPRDPANQLHAARRPMRPGTSALLAVLTSVALAGCSGSPSTGAATSLSVADSASTSASTSGSPAPSATASPSADPGIATDQAVALETAYRRVIASVLPSVVEIRTQQALGSGVIFDDRGDIVTNAHVVGQATRFEVYVPGKADPVSATLKGVYPPDDLAVITLADPSGTRAATFGDSSALQVGDIVLAMGNPLGLASSVTNGIVSALGRTVSEPQAQDSPGATIPDTIQTSAAINPGNSGGALVDLDGEVVGIPTLAAVSPEGGGAAPGIGFAISSDTVRRIAPQLISAGKVTNSGRAALGLRVTAVTDQQGNPAGVGVVAVTSGGPAAKAGIAVGDVISSVAGQQVPSPQALAAALANQKVGETVPVQVARDSSAPKTVQVTLGELETP